MDQHSKSQRQNSSNVDNSIGNSDDDKPIDPKECPFIECTNLKLPCIKCNTNKSCNYGEIVNATCDVDEKVECLGPRQFQRPYICRYCFLTNHWEHHCVQKSPCNSHSTYKSNCSVHNDVICIGNRTFSKNIKCNYTRGVKYRTALILSIVFGGFGVGKN
jgi:hypothetical protein